MLYMCLAVNCFAGSERDEPRTKLLYRSYATYGVPVVLIVVVRTRIYVVTVEVQVVGVVGIVGSRRPIVAVVATIVRRRTVPVAGIDEYTTRAGGHRLAIRGKKRGSLQSQISLDIRDCLRRRGLFIKVCLSEPREAK